MPVTLCSGGAHAACAHLVCYIELAHLLVQVQPLVMISLLPALLRRFCTENTALG